MTVLVLTHRLPFPPNRGDRVRAYHLVRCLQQHAEVRVVSLVHDRGEAAAAAELERMGIRTWTAHVPRFRNLLRGAAALGGNAALTHVLLDSPEIHDAIRDAVTDGAPDVVLAYCSGMARFALEPPLRDLPLIVDFVDVDSAKWSDFARMSRHPRRFVYQRESHRLAAFEAQAAERAFASTVVNDRERQALVRLAPAANAHTVPNGVDVDRLAPPCPPGDQPRVIFPAVFNYQPNSDGAIWFAREVWPIVRARIPHATLTLAGASPIRAVRQLGVRDASIEITGSVPDMRPYLWRSAVAIAPLFLARGLQNKVLEAAAAGLPSVVTPAVRDGLPAEVLPACRTAAAPRDFADAVIDLLSLSAGDRRRLVGEAQLTPLTWERRLARMSELVQRASRHVVSATPELSVRRSVPPSPAGTPA